MSSTDQSSAESQAETHAKMITRPEVLAPVGDLQALGAALSAGADAVYFGLEGQFNARAKSEGISLDTLDEVVQRCHHAGAKALVTLNTLIFEPELPRVALFIEAAAAAGIDALIVQDPAVALLARELAPTLEVHASTQMTISSPEAARFAGELGVTRVVVPRELTVSQIARFKRETPLELEVFVHGALCMSWSGQCLTSEAWGGRSANRGQCAQSCRMPYDLLVDGEERPLGEVKYLLSPRDLAGVRAVESLMEVGVECLKIEGRYKGPAYVKSAVETYKGWVDVVARGDAGDSDAQRALTEQMTGLSLAYSRGFSDGFLGGKDHQSLVEGRFPKHRGVFLGYVTSVSDEENTGDKTGRDSSGGPWIEISARGDGRRYSRETRGRRSDALPLYDPDREEPARRDESAEELRQRGPLLAPLTPIAGMGVVFDDGRPEEDERGGRIIAVEQREGGWRIRLHRSHKAGGEASGAELAVGQRVWVNSDPELNREAAKSARHALEHATSGRIEVDLAVSGALGEPLELKLTTRGPNPRYVGVAVSALTDMPLVSQERSLTRETLAAKLGALGGTPLSMRELTVSLPPSAGLPVSALKRVRRAAVESLLTALDTRRPHATSGAGLSALKTLKGSLQYKHTRRERQAENRAEAQAQTRLVPLCRTMEQLEALISCRTRLGEARFPEVELDWMEFVGLRGAVERAREAGLEVTIATVRVQQPGEEVFDKRITELKPDGVLLRHWGGLIHFSSLPEESRPKLHGDFSLNVTNSLTARHVASYGLETLTAAHDLDADQLHAMLDEAPHVGFAVTLHHHIPTFHTEHCVYAHTLSSGRDSRSCGRPCESHRVALRDHKGLAHPVLVDVKCRNTVFNASAQTAASLADALAKRGVARMRIEFVWEDAAQATRVLEAYDQLIRGELSPSRALAQLQTHERFGLTTGTMEVHR